MQKKTDKFLDKIVKKDYNNELEKVLEEKYFNENVKNILLNILYKIETAYKDYEKVKPNVPTKEELIETIIEGIKNNCDTIKIVKLNSKESQLLGNRTFLVDKEKKRIVCYPIERKVLYCLSKINKNEQIIKDKHSIINKTLSDLINVGNNIDTVEPMRDFNGYSWTTIPREIESIYHNLAYQNMRILVGYKFLDSWIKNNHFIIDYFESFQNKLEKKYGKQEQENLLELFEKLSILLAYRYNKKLNTWLQKEKKETEAKLAKMQDNQKFIQEITKEKQDLEKQIRKIDETINNKTDLQEEYEKRNENLPLEEKIFSIRILSKMMMEEREQKIKRIEKLNILLTPKKFVVYKEELQRRENYLKILETTQIDEEIEKYILDLQKTFLQCYRKNIEKIDNKQELMKYIYEFRYYCLLPFNQEKLVYQIEELQSEIEKTQMLLIEKANNYKLIEVFSRENQLNLEILKNIFYVRVINLEDLYMKCTKEKESYYIQLFDENVFEEKIEINNIGVLNKKDLAFKINKKVKIFN